MVTAGIPLDSFTTAAIMSCGAERMPGGQRGKPGHMNTS